MRWVRALPAEAIPVGEARRADVSGERVLLCRIAPDELYAVEDSCSHDDGPLDQGRLEGAVIECPRHGARFDVRTGAALRMPAASPIEAFPVRLRDGWAEVGLQEEGP